MAQKKMSQAAIKKRIEMMAKDFMERMDNDGEPSNYELGYYNALLDVYGKDGYNPLKSAGYI